MALVSRREYDHSSGTEPELIPDPGAPAVARLLDSERYGSLVAAVHQLPARQKAALVLRYGHELPMTEIAELLGVGSGSVKTHLRRGLQALRAAELGE